MTSLRALLVVGALLGGLLVARAPQTDSTGSVSFDTSTGIATSRPG